MSLARIKQRPVPSFDKKSFHHRHFLRYSWTAANVILSQAGRARHAVICINPAFTKMIQGTEKSKIPSKFAKRIARYNEFRYKITTMEFLVSFFFFVGDSNSSLWVVYYRVSVFVHLTQQRVILSSCRALFSCYCKKKPKKGMLRTHKLIFFLL